MQEQLKTDRPLANEHGPAKDDLSDSSSLQHVTLIFTWVVYAVLCQLIDVFGICTNIINIVCFVKQGFKDPVNVSLLGLAISDLGCLTTLLWTNVCHTPALSTSDLPFEPAELDYLTGAWPHITFARITACITALITFERCLSIIAPLKVKGIVTTKRVSILMVCVFIILMSSVAPIYVVNKLGMKFFPLKNKTLLGLVFSSDKDKIESVSYMINNLFVPIIAFVVIIICTVLLAYKLHSKAKWRKTITVTTQVDHVSSRNQKVAKMVVMISSLFIVCFMFFMLIFLAMLVEPELSIGGKYFNILTMLAGMGILLESVNSSANIFIYYHMSTNFRTTFNQLFVDKTKSTQASLLLKCC